MRRFEGDIAPAFTAKDLYGNEIDLANFKGKKVFLSFFRNATCPFCNLRVHELIQHQEDFAKHDMEVILFFSSDAEVIKSYVGKQKVIYPIIPDSELVHYKAYGIESSFFGMFIAMFRIKSLMKIFKKGFFNLRSMRDTKIPADILVDERGLVKIAYFGNDYGDHLPLNQLFNS